MLGPKIEPIFQTNGIRLNALGCSSLNGTISATVVLIIPTFPLPAPARTLATIATAKFVLKPHIKLVIIVAVKPRRMAGLRPWVSENLPQATPKVAWLKEKTAAQIPAHLPTAFCGTPKLRIISGRYGKSEVLAMGSAKRHMAGRRGLD
jgi:hypothetical protein